MEIKYVFTRKRREFGAPCHFTDVGPNIIVDIHPNPRLMRRFVHMSKVDQASQCHTSYSFHVVNTLTEPTESRGMDHIEGGWPADVDHKDEDQVARFRKKVEKDEHYVSAIRNLSTVTEQLVMENNALDIYQHYFAGEEMSEEDTNLKTLSVQRDFSSVSGKLARSVSGLSWSPDGTKVATAYSSESTSHFTSNNTDSYIWDIGSTVEPHMVLRSETAIVSLAYSESLGDMLACGFENGQVGVYDLSKKDGNEPHVQLSPVPESHSAEVSAICWLHSKSGTEFISSSFDGRVISWDARDLTMCTNQFLLQPAPMDHVPKGNVITCLEYDPTVPYHFMVGTDDGWVYVCNRRAEPQQCISAEFHCCRRGAVLSIQRNPFVPKVFLVATAWYMQLWSEDYSNAPLMVLIASSGYMVDVKWCSTRPSVLLATKSTGCLEVWDVLIKQNKPTSSFKLEDVPLTCLQPLGGESRKLACGSLNGSVHILEVPKWCADSTKMEKARVTAMFERDSEKLALLELKSKSQRLMDEDAARLAEEAERLKKMEICPNWEPTEIGEETYAELKELEYGSGFLSEEELETHQKSLYKELGVEEETGEEKFLEVLDREVQTDKALKSALVEVVTEIESDTSKFPLPEIEIVEEYGEEEFLGDLQTFTVTREAVDDVLKQVPENE